MLELGQSRKPKLRLLPAKHDRMRKMSWNTKLLRWRQLKQSENERRMKCQLIKRAANMARQARIAREAAEGDEARERIRAKLEKMWAPLQRIFKPEKSGESHTNPSINSFGYATRQTPTLWFNRWMCSILVTPSWVAR